VPEDLQPLLTSRLSTQHDTSNYQGNGGSEDIPAYTLLKRERRPEAPPSGLRSSGRESA